MKSWLSLQHDDVIKRNHFPHYWPFVWGIHRSPVNSPLKGQWRRALMFSLICARINAWVNNHEAGDLIRHHTHYGVTVKNFFISYWSQILSCDQPHLHSYFWKWKHKFLGQQIKGFIGLFLRLIWVFHDIFIIKCIDKHFHMIIQRTKFMRPTWGPPGSCRSQMGPMLAPWTLLSG